MKSKIYVWDLFVRFFHWSLVACVALNFITEDGELTHQWIGYIACALIGARVIWGFAGSQYARFSEFFPTPDKIRHHLGEIASLKTPNPIGHNPLGAIAMLTMMALVVSLGVTGYLQVQEYALTYFGEEGLEELHEMLANTLLVLGAIHAASAVLIGKLQKTNLIKAMFTGYKEFDEDKNNNTGP